MLDACVNQGAGLQQIGLQTAPKVIAMASHGDQQGELPLLWSLCSTLVDLGYSVVVLDAHAAESENNPGLLQLFDGTSWPNDQSGAPNAWSVLPAAQGLRQMTQHLPTSDRLLAPLGGLLGNYGVIVLYAQADILVDLLPGSGIEPLLTVSPLKMSSITAYKSLKQMLQNAGLKPTVAHIAVHDNAMRGQRTQSTIHKLQECSMAFLGYKVDALTIRVGDAEARIADDVHRLTLRLLENAMPLPRYQPGGSL
ncbi:hypothetical protein [Rhodoferax sp. PAMC 29310]|uniref:hypothetical protein n=1 Tax=Rhodoferax sp. PAMC 29310 TaxID=2822760 RepID=UPI001B328F53|nr:hypothetical protein [Rhodoferax sp. PAMC 29310]